MNPADTDRLCCIAAARLIVDPATAEDTKLLEASEMDREGMPEEMVLRMVRKSPRVGERLCRRASELLLPGGVVAVSGGGVVAAPTRLVGVRVEEL